MDGNIWVSIGILLTIKYCIAADNYCIKDKVIYIEYGNPLDMPCTLTGENTKFHNKDLYFTKDKKTVPRGDIIMLNPSSIKLRIQKPPKSKSTYACKLENTEVCSNTVIIDTKPLPIIDLECTSYNFQNLTCTWTSPKSLVEISYNLTYYFPTDKHVRNPCPKLIPHANGTKFSCSWTEHTVPQYKRMHPEIYFELTMTNVFGTTRIKKTFSHYEHVIPNPPVELTYLNKTTESVYLRWAIPPEMQVFPAGLQHRVMYSSEYGQKEWQVGGMLETSAQDQMKYVHFNLTNLPYAYSLYNIRVSMRSLAAKSDESVWSGYLSYGVRTLGKIPDSPPATNIGGFEIIPTSNDSANVYVYWENQIKIGDDSKYHVQMKGPSGVEDIETYYAFAEFKNLSVSENYTFRIWSKNNFGRSEKESVMFVPALSERIEEPESFTITPYGSGKYELSWNISNNSTNIKNYTIFWCASDWDQGLQRCLGVLHWEYTFDNKTSFNLTLLDDTINQFGISANSEPSSSGIVWNTCANIQNNGMGRLRNVWINKVYPTSIEITWRNHCIDDNVRSFTLYYCNVVDKTNETCKGEYENMLIPIHSRTNKANITGLKPDETYFVRAAVTNHYRKNQRTYTRLITSTLDEVPNPPSNITVTNTTKTSISISWQKPRIISKDMIFYEVVCTNGSHRTSNITNSEQFTITNLMSYTEYKIHIRACIVKCSKHSETLNIRTQGGVPSEVSQLHVMFQHETGMIVVWEQPQYPEGRNLFEVYFKKLEHGHPISYYTEDTCFETDNCNEKEKYNKFYISVRAVNFFDGERYEGPWSEEFELQCLSPPNIWLWMILPAFIVLLIVLFFLGKRIYQHYKEELYVDVVLPSGLASEANDDPKIWGRPSVDETALAIKLFNSGHLNDNLNCPISEDENAPYPFKLKHDSLNRQLISSPREINKDFVSLHDLGSSSLPKQYAAALPNKPSDDKSCDNKNLAERCDSMSGHEDETRPCLSTENRQSITDYYKHVTNLQNAPSNQHPQGYVIVGADNANPLITSKSESPSNYTQGYVTIGTDNDNPSVPSRNEDKKGDKYTTYTLPQGYVAVGEDSTNYSLPNSTEDAENSNISVCDKEQIIRNFKNLQNFAKNHYPNGYVTVGADTNSPSSNEHEESQLISSNNINQNLASSSSRATENSPQRLQDSRGYVTLPSQT